MTDKKKKGKSGDHTEESAVKDDAAEEPEVSAEKESPEKEIAPPEKTREEELEEQLSASNDKFLRLYAEFDNFRRRTARQQLEMQKTAGSETIREVLPVLDDFDRAIESNKEIDDPKTLREGFELIHNKFKKTLERQGLSEIDAKGKPFDTDLHEAITNIPAPSKDLKGKVVDVVEKGYYLNDQVLRFSKVVVGQ